jgi:hypothetical protein
MPHGDRNRMRQMSWRESSAPPSAPGLTVPLPPPYHAAQAQGSRRGDGHAALTNAEALVIRPGPRPNSEAGVPLTTAPAPNRPCSSVDRAPAFASRAVAGPNPARGTTEPALTRAALRGYRAEVWLSTLPYGVGCSGGMAPSTQVGRGPQVCRCTPLERVAQMGYTTHP